MIPNRALSGIQIRTRCCRQIESIASPHSFEDLNPKEPGCNPIKP